MPGIWEDLGGAAVINMFVPPTQTAAMRSWSGPCTYAPWAPLLTMGSSLRRALPGCMVSAGRPMVGWGDSGGLLYKGSQW